ncbi:hypothetical protein LAUMK35_00097 [Mycobacterium pseudokansasii]|uniref:Uncharacterized protein n=1 Tax=Mycobacterium pseudokansasii TaxID=2341080 RepID=A0A498QZI6_9MYCO|nr:hypothetical protein LAUMK35_00097 [Mycobacterium pseudokansasii]VAZ87540.1 hypothetical protein LAUMK21_00095 [Mycobacterium pseudokansasii]VBA56871.1 hypothetical protein LAUMK142_05716 [Mycobacterium pseudokansasii]
MTAPSRYGDAIDAIEAACSHDDSSHAVEDGGRNG